MSGSVPIVTIVMSISLIIASANAQYVHLERVSLWDKIDQFDTNVYLYLRRLDKASLTCTSAFLGEERVDFVSLLSDDCTIKKKKKVLSQ